MQLKKLVVSGFKSFADKVILNFDDGITGIVGPNGSGKSNVIDAVRWVMGEQNAKHLRGQIATDIIFAGSDKRKALGMAEVTLVFDNADISPYCPPEYRHEPEISLTRRLYVDGQREYLINRKSCRLKDIVGFFATSGLGGRSYSMIQQGQVDRILNAKPEDVREILEEAAGTMVFKNRRAAAIKKLETTQDNLSRIEDIVGELERQLEALQGQVEKAELWQQFNNELKETELNLFAHNFVRSTATLQELVEQNDKDTDKEVALVSEVSQLEVEVEKLQRALAEADPELDQIRENISLLREQIARAEGTIATAMAAMESGEKRLLEIDQSIDNDNEGLDILRSQVAKTMADYDKASQNLEDCKDRIESFRLEVDEVEESAQVFENRSDELNDQLRSLDRLLENNGIRCETIDRERQRIRNDIEQRHHRLTQIHEGLTSTNEQIEEQQKDVASKQYRLDECLAKKHSLTEQIEAVHGDMELKRTQRENVREQYLEAKSRHQSLLILEEQDNSIEETLDQLSQSTPQINQLMIGVLSDLIEYGDQAADLSETVKSVFETWAERIVVDSQSNLDRIARVMSQERLGTLPVSFVDNKVIAVENPALEALGNYLQLKNSSTALQSVVGRLFILKPSYSLAQVKDDIPQGIVTFTSEGIIYTGDLDFVIQAQKQGQGKLSRRAEIEDLYGIIAHYEQEITTIDQHLTEGQARLEELKLALNDTQQLVDEKNKLVLETISGLQTIKQNQTHQNELLGDAQRMIAELEQRDRELMLELEELGDARISIGQEKENLEYEIESLQEEFESIGDRKEEVRRMLQNNEVDLAKIETRVHSLKESLEQNSQQLERAEGGVQRRREERLNIEQQIQQSEIAKAQSRQEMEVYLHRRDELEEELGVRREKSADILDALKAVETRLKSSRKAQSELQTGLVKKQAEIERIRQSVKTLIEDTKEKYRVDLMTYQFDYDSNMNAVTVKEKVQALKNKIENLGAINMIAIEEYHRLQERYEFIHGQREEVTGSILLLEEAIMEIEDTSREKFASIFETVNNNFQDLFPILFPGGEAKLHLTDEEDMLNAGVEIMVRMPGKTPRSMTLYSGGEKALTAISLIFALLKTKPTPFCFLDEVDAPLDEANVGRYNKVLTALSDRFQFIVITHNRRTMEALDQLYGVTMQEGGVSTVVGVDMKKDLPAHLQKSFKDDMAARQLEGATVQ